MSRVRIQLLLAKNTWITIYNIPEKDQYSDTSTQWKKLSLNFTVENYGIKFLYDKVDSAHADMCFISSTITQSVY